MELINNRYRVVKVIEQTYQLTSYLVADLRMGHKLLYFYILNDGNMSSNMMDFFSSRFINLKNMNNSSLVNLVQYGLVTTIDNKKLKEYRYFYSTEYFNYDEDSFKSLCELSNWNRLDAFASLCNIINTLHLKGYVYGSISFDNIFTMKDNGINIKMRDLATVYVEGFDYWKSNVRDAYYKAPELSKGTSNTIASDIYSLGMALVKLFNLEGFRINLNSGNIYEGYNQADNFESKLLKIADRMIDKNPEKRYARINQVIRDINEEFNKNYEPFNMEAMEKLNFNTVLIGREYPKFEAAKAYDLMIKAQKGRILGIHGEAGVGKTRVLRELRHIFKMSRVKVYTTFITENNSDNANGPMELLKKATSECESEILAQYDEELKRFLPDGIANKQMPFAFNISQKERFRLINRLSSFISELTKDKPIVLIIDNIHFTSLFFIELIEYIYSNEIKNLMIIFSYDDGEYEGNKKFEDMIGRLKGSGIYSDVKLNSLSQEETLDLVQNILSMPHSPVKFGKRVYSQTYGNPLFIEEVIKNLYAGREIFVDSENGQWSTSYNIDNIPIPINMEQAILNQIREIDKNSLELLNAICIFNDAVSISAISKVAAYSSEATEKLVNELVRKGIISQKINDRGFVFEFYNKVLKKLVYERISDKEKKDRHKLAAMVLEDLIEHDYREYKDELIYHLEMADERDKVIKYCMENADRFDKLNFRDLAVKNIEKAISMFDGLKPDIRLLQLLIRLGDTYRDQGNIENALQNYERSIEIATDLKQYKQCIDALNKIAFIYYDRNEIDMSIRYLEKAEGMLAEFEYIKGMLKAKSLRIILLELRQESDRALELCNEAIALCGDGYLKYKGRLLNILGNIYLDTGRINEAMESFKASISCYEKVNYIKGTLNPLNNIGVIYGDYYQNDEKAIEYFLKMKTTSEKANLPGAEVSALVNLGETYFYKWNFDEALKWFEDALEKAEKFYYESLIFYSYMFVSNIYLLMTDYKNAYKYFELASRELLDHPDQGRAIDEYYRIGANIFFEFGSLERAQELLGRALEKYGEEKSILRRNCEVLRSRILISQSKDTKELYDIINEVFELASRLTRGESRANALYDAAIELYEGGHLEHAKYFLQKFSVDTDEPKIQVKKLYLEGLLSEGPEKMDILNRALDLAIKVKNKKIHWKVCSAIGDLYFSGKNYFYAVNFYYEACEIVKSMVLTFPERYRVNFVNFHGLNYPFHMLYIVKQHYNNSYQRTSKALERVKDLKELEKLFEYVSLRDILTNKYFIKSAQSIYDSLSGSKVRSIKDIVTQVYSEPIKNLEMVLRYLSRITLAKTAFILSEENNRQLKVLAGIGEEDTRFKSNYIVDRVRVSREALLVVDKETGLDELHLKTNSSEARAVICIPIIINRNEVSTSVFPEKRSFIHESGDLIGYIYLESDKILNNFNAQSMRICKQLIPFTGLIIEEQKLRINSSVDKLTGALTRKFMEDQLDKQISQAETQNRNFSVIIFDLDYFKGINDLFGHQTGDEVLREVCSTIMQNIRKVDSCGRYGGEEFVILLPDTDAEGAEKLAEKLRQKVENKGILGTKRAVTISMGVAAYPIHGRTSQDLIERADQALYVAKEKGRNRVQLWKTEFSGHVKGTDKLTGVISGNAVQDYRNVSVMVDLMELIKREASVDQKIYELLGRIIEITEAQHGILFTVDNGMIVNKHGRRIFQEGWIEEIGFNKNILNHVMEEKQGVYLIDWDEISEYDPITGMPDWKSIAVVPLITSGIIRGVLYLSVSTKMKEFRFEEFNFINILGQIAVALL